MNRVKSFEASILLSMSFFLKSMQNAISIRNLSERKSMRSILGYTIYTIMAFTRYVHRLSKLTLDWFRKCSGSLHIVNKGHH